MPSSAGGLPGSGDTDDCADATGKLSGAVSARWPAESPPAGVLDWSPGAGGAGAAACTGVAGACVSSDADDEWCVMTDPTMMMAMRVAASEKNAMRRAQIARLEVSCSVKDRRRIVGWFRIR